MNPHLHPAFIAANKAQQIAGMAGTWHGKTFKTLPFTGISGSMEEAKDGARAQGATKLFVRWPYGEAADICKPTASVPLIGGRDQAFASPACATHRSQVRRARALGGRAEIQVAPSESQLLAFKQLYDETMRRVDAADHYFYGPDYYSALTGLGNGLCLVTVHAPEPVSMALGISGGGLAYYHLSARHADAPNWAGNLAIDALTDWAAATGSEALHLGGGTSDDPDDPLLCFKRRIGSLRTSAWFTEYQL